MSSLKKIFADTTSLFQICVSNYPEPVARVAAVALFWCQCATHSFKGRKGIYKEDRDLAEEIGKHPKTVGRSLLKICTSNKKPRDNALFEVAYGPKPGAYGGRVRWLFVEPRGVNIIEEAIKLREQKVENKAIKRNKKFQQVTADCSNQSPQIAPTLSQINPSYKPAEILSAVNAGEKNQNLTEEKETFQGEVQRIVKIWNIVCDKLNKHEQRWHSGEVARFNAYLLKTVDQIGSAKLSDELLERQLSVLCLDLKAFDDDLSEAFYEFNKDGLRVQSFCRYGPKLMKLAAKPPPPEFKPKITAEQLFGHKPGEKSWK